MYLSHYPQKLGKLKTIPNDELQQYYANLQYEREVKKSKDQLKVKRPGYKSVNLHKAAPEAKVENIKTPDEGYYSDVKFKHEYNNDDKNVYAPPKQQYIKIEHVQNHAPVQKVAGPELGEDYAKYEQGFNNRHGKLELPTPYGKHETTATPKTPDVVYYSDVKFEHEYNNKNDDYGTKQPYVNIQTGVKHKAESPKSGAPDVVYYSDIKFEHAYDDTGKPEYGAQPYEKPEGKQKDKKAEHDLVYYTDIEYEHEYNDHKDDYKPPNIKTKHSHKTDNSRPNEYYNNPHDHEFDKNKDDFGPSQGYAITKTTPKLQKTKTTSNPDHALDHFADAEYDYEYNKHRAQIENDEPYVDTHYGDIEYEYNKQRAEIEAEHPYIKSHHSEIDYDYNKQKDDIEALNAYKKPQPNHKVRLGDKPRKSKPYHPAEDLAARYADFEYEYELTKKRAEFAEEPYSDSEYDDDKDEKSPSVNTNNLVYRTKTDYEDDHTTREAQKPAAPKFQARIIQNSQPEIILLSKEAPSEVNQAELHSTPHSAAGNSSKHL